MSSSIDKNCFSTVLAAADMVSCLEGVQQVVVTFFEFIGTSLTLLGST